MTLFDCYRGLKFEPKSHMEYYLSAGRYSIMISNYVCELWLKPKTPLQIGQLSVTDESKYAKYW